MKQWLCRCGHRNEPGTRKCRGCGKKKPAKRVPAHARTLRDDSYEVYNEMNAAIHGVTDESCAVCNKPRGQDRRHDRDHDHATGKPRGLACWRCNRIMVKDLTLDRARAIVAYLERVEAYWSRKGKNPFDSAVDDPEG